MPSLSGAAVGSTANVGNLVNNPVAVPATEQYPGAVNPDLYNQPGTVDPARGGPVIGTTAVVPFRSSEPLQQDGGGGVQDTAWVQGHDAPTEPWNSSAGEPFAPSGALNPDLHGEDTGGVFAKEHVIGPAFGPLRRATIPGQTHVNLASTRTTIGQTEPNNRINWDQAQYNDHAGHAPRPINYSERPILNNIAYQSIATTGGSPYTPDGSLPNRAPLPYGSQAYAAPPDPLISDAPQAGGTSSGRWTIG